tara:strand:+ start:29 stop:841 length:813 start_codon:yes stop_codon:yes gene_type:complete
MKILLNNLDLNEALYNKSNIGFIPTMGSLHKGHISLIRKAIQQCDTCVVSIFVNPTQFNNKKDFQNYPRDIEKDLKILRKLSIGFVYIPKIEHIYNTSNIVKIKLSKKEKILCAKFRKGHFEGVLNVMTRLTNIIKPSKIFMGEKDLQQLILVRKYIEKNLKVKIVSCKTIRDKNKLALSSRNNLLSKDEKLKAGKIARYLISFKKQLSIKKNFKKIILIKKKYLEELHDIKIEYLELRNKFNLKISSKKKNAKLFLAYNIGKVRLIDNF